MLVPLNVTHSTVLKVISNSKINKKFNSKIVDSGGQYENGCTTDVTRTFHFGNPEAEQIQMYTRVLMGSIDLVTNIEHFKC